MATSLMRLGRLGSIKSLQVKRWDVLRRGATAALCTQAEETKAAGNKAPAVAPPEPEEPFDNSTYKNYQHHNYSHYTFADLDLEMAKFRLPQPSSGRPSPRH
ncbi:NADH dehydrogenase flavoprotein 3 mitochondrial [Scophthalmus maximus]|uniref:NADH dehydrogenase flavoprotein 3 mitochondrial n=1 Tax=Scophthalmus maximus TaxID=52904 RepID=A0A2U9CA85_SCOMX|nr:NADH dehydrogenase flavoprotein 3 mitochondrial [Scophthalmus maximus]